MSTKDGLPPQQQPKSTRNVFFNSIIIVAFYMRFFYQKRNCFFFSLREMSFMIILESFCRYTAHTHTQTHGDRVVPITTQEWFVKTGNVSETAPNETLNSTDLIGSERLHFYQFSPPRRRGVELFRCGIYALFSEPTTNEHFKKITWKWNTYMNRTYVCMCVWMPAGLSSSSSLDQQFFCTHLCFNK